ncbi:hypothetical protein KCP74_14980 [Salmonella enterica subsp. enterica]|nr:hypothetical protein KCP74_14980 [Salmonella enterica subsp. enterica]
MASLADTARWWRSRRSHGPIPNAVAKRHALLSVADRPNRHESGALFLSGARRKSSPAASQRAAVDGKARHVDTHARAAAKSSLADSPAFSGDRPTDSLMGGIEQSPSKQLLILRRASATGHLAAGNINPVWKIVTVAAKHAQFAQFLRRHRRGPVRAMNTSATKGWPACAQIAERIKLRDSSP